MDFTALFVTALAAEACWESTKLIWKAGKAGIDGVVDRLGGIALGIFLCTAAGVDFFQMVGLPLSVPYAGMVLSGLLVSRGANFLHDFLTIVMQLKNGNKTR
ncbi:MAG: hypothetical protein ACUVRO_04145 [Armatimonadota bacterium]